jgi:predicted nucleic acid-binding protein
VNVLVDTSIWSLALCRRPHDLNLAEQAAVAELTNLIKEEPAATADYEAAAKAGNDCRARGIAVSVSDILICAIAIGRDWSIFATDRDFFKLHTPRK